MTVSPRTNEPEMTAEEILEGIVRWVEHETPSSDATAVNRLVDRVEGELREIGAVIERTPGRDGYGDILKASTPPGSHAGGYGPGILVLAHLDTVHPHGTLGRNAVRREDDRVYGPGIYDMKGGAYLATYAWRHLLRLGRDTKLPLRILFMPDEEVGSPTSRETIEREARNAKHVLVVEPARDGGRIVSGRKGVARYRIEARGRPAHAGVRHQDGRSAIREIARVATLIEGLTDYDRGITTNVGLIGGGTGVNVVPQNAWLEADARLPDMASSDEVCGLIDGLKAENPDVALTVTGGLNRPPYERTAATESLLDHARSIATDIGFDLVDVTTGGGSDGNFTAALGVPTLDGLGVDGAGAHTEEEHLLYSSLVPRARLLAGLFESLE